MTNLRDEYDHYRACCFYEGAGALESSLLGFAWWRAGHALRALVCKVRGHQIVDLDPGNPENGPMPEIVCERCDKEW